jgi:hypothetical protein
VVEQNQRRVGVGHNANNLFKLALADQARGIGLLAALDNRSGNGRAGGSGEFLEFGTARLEIDIGSCIASEVFFSCHSGGRGASKSSRCGRVRAFAEISGEFDHDQHSEFQLSLRGAQFAGEKCRILSRTCLDQSPPDCLSPISA